MNEDSTRISHVHVFRADIQTPHRQKLIPLTVLGFIGVTASGCAATEVVDPAPNAQAPECADVMLALPDEVDEFERRDTASQSTAVWGDPSAIVLRCGMEPIGPTTDPCVAPGDVDWVMREDDDHVQLISYGRDPAVEVLLDTDEVDESATMNAQFALSSPVTAIEQTRECTENIDPSPEEEPPEEAEAEEPHSHDH